LPTLAASPVIPEKAASGIGGPFTLVDQDGRTITDEKFRGKWLLVYFGYTHCPDACPTALSDMAEAISDLDPLSATRFSQSSSASTPSATRRQS
jgi:protein SCO1/2